MTHPIEIQGLTRTYRRGPLRRKVVAVRDLTLDTRPGEIFGFLGHNGAGKSTTIRILVGLARPTRGEARLLGHRAGDPRSRRKLGYLPENPFLNPGWTVEELLSLSASLAGISRGDVEASVSRVVDRLELGALLDRRLGKMSKGQIQMVGVAQALLGEPELLILDEPMSGLDPMARKRVRDVVLEHRAEGGSVFLSSHILGDVEMICDRIALLDHGRLLGVHDVSAIQRDGLGDVEIAVAGVTAAAAEEITGVCEVREAGAHLVLRLPGPDAVNGALSGVLVAGGTVVSVQPVTRTLEDFVLASIEAGHAAGDTDDPSVEEAA